MEAVAKLQIIVGERERHAGRNRGDGIAAGNGRRRLQPLFALLEAHRIGDLGETRRPAGTGCGVSERRGAVGRRHRVDEKIGVVAEARGDADDIGDRREVAVAVVCKGGAPAEGVGDLADEERLAGDAVGECRLAADGIGD
jgi:hypothetical protein